MYRKQYDKVYLGQISLVYVKLRDRKYRLAIYNATRAPGSKFKD
jgi:hypothetical protein